MTTTDDTTPEPYTPTEESLGVAVAISQMLPVTEGKEAVSNFLARVRRDAAREALDGLIRDLQEKGRCAADSSLPDVSDLAEVIWHAQDEARTYRDRMLDGIA